MLLLDAVRRPEYTGDRRCWPCTAANALLLGVGAAAVAAVWRPLAALVVAGVGAVLLWLRGYLVPYTPAFAPRLTAALGLGELFHADASGPPDAPDTPDAPGSLGGDDTDGEALLDALLAADVLEADERGVGLAPGFAAEWHEEMADLRELDTPALAEAAAAVAPAPEVRAETADGREWVVLSEGERVLDEAWLPRAVAVAEVAAVRALDGRLGAERRPAAAGTLRMFLEACPDCGTALEESSTAACCGGFTDPTGEPDETLVCPNCRVQLFEFAD